MHYLWPPPIECAPHKGRAASGAYFSAPRTEHTMNLALHKYLSNGKRIHDPRIAGQIMSWILIHRIWLSREKTVFVKNTDFEGINPNRKGFRQSLYHLLSWTLCSWVTMDLIHWRCVDGISYLCLVALLWKLGETVKDNDEKVIVCSHTTQP